MPTLPPSRTYVLFSVRVLLIVSLLLTQLTPPLVQAAPPTAPLRQEPAPDQAPLALPDESLTADTVVTNTVTANGMAAPALATVVDQSLGIYLTLEVERPILTPATTSAVTLTVRAEMAVTTDKAVLTLTLPKGTATTTGDKNKVQWTLPVMAAGELFQQQVQLQIDNANSAVKRDIGDLSASVDAPDYPRVETSTLLALAPTAPATADVQDMDGALIASSDGDVILLAQPAAAPAGVLFEYTELYNWETVTTTVTATNTIATPLPHLTLADSTAVSSTGSLTATSLLTTNTSADGLYLPLIQAGASEQAVGSTSSPTASLRTTVGESASELAELGEPTAKHDHNLDAYRVWQLDATQAGQKLQHFDQEVLVQVSVKKLVKAGIDPVSLALWTREGAEGRWTPVPTVYDAKHERLQAWLPHFSQFGLGAGLQQSGDMLPSVKAFTVDALNGGAGVSLPIETPSGMGGLNPNLSLSYSSITLDDLFREAGDFAIEGQAGSAGIGWQLGGVSYIARTDTQYDDGTLDTDKKFALVLNGTRVGIAYQDGKWRANPEIFAKIEWDSTRSNDAHDFGGWRVWTGEGTQYEFGDAGTFSPTSVFNSSSPNGTGLERTFGGNTLRLTKRWYLRKVTDPLGNSMEYGYQGEQGWERGCVDDSWVSAGKNWYTRAIDPANVYWNGQGTNYTMRAIFTYAAAARADIQITGSGDNDCIQPLYGSNNQLTTITVQVFNGTTWHTLRSYSLGQSIYTFTRAGQSDKKRLYLSTFEQKGKAGALLQRYTFGYNFNNSNGIRLNSASSTLGGSVSYTYSTYRTSCNIGTCPFTMDRYAVTRQSTGDGLNNTRTVDYDYGPSVAGNETSAVANDGGFMGYKEVRTNYYATNSVTSEIRRELLVSFTGGAAADRDNPDPRRGKLKRREVWNLSTGGTLYQAEDYDWKAYWLEAGAWQSTATTASWKWVGSNVVYPITWLKLEKETQTIDTAVNEKRYTYEGAYGNQTEMQEWANSSLQRKTLTDFYPNSSAWIVNLPARVRIQDSGSACKAETRYIYGAYYTGSTYTSNVENNYTAQPLNTGLLVKTEQALSACSSTATIAKYDAAWAITRLAYDRYGNQTTVNSLGNASNGSQDIVIQSTYDTAYHLFPIEQWYAASTLHKETASYYGVNGLGLSDSKAFWGAMQEHCGVNDVCTRQSYDEFGRRVRRWEAAAKGSSWGTDSNAHVLWTYTLYGSGQTGTTLLEWRNPRGEGNFVRKVYNGLGELIQEQRPYQNWASSGGQEIMIDYRYDALGRQDRAGTPWLTAKYSSGDLRRSANWAGGYTATAYDPLGRPTVVTAPNGEQQQYSYAGRAYALFGIGRNGEGNKVLKWEESNGLGYPLSTRTFNPSGSNWTQDGQVTLTHNVLGNLTNVAHPNSIAATTLTYDLGGRKTAMTDPDLGSWSYAYDRQGKLTRQTDAKGQTTCLNYDSLGRVATRYFKTSTDCAWANVLYYVSYGYDANHSATSRSRGQLTSAGYNDQRWWQTLTYNDKGQLASETLALAGAPHATYLTSYTYDSYLRSHTTTYPDGETITTGYNSMGLPSTLVSNLGGANFYLLNNISYDEAGRLRTLQLAVSGNRWRSYGYFPWVATAGLGLSNSDSNGRLRYIAVGNNPDGGQLHALYNYYDSFGNVVNQTDPYGAYTFAYDTQNRLDNGYGRGYLYDSVGRLTYYEGTPLIAGGLRAHMSLPSGTYSFDTNGNLTQRNAQSLTWDHENHLSNVSGGGVNESYLYDPNGRRIKKTTTGVGSTFYVNALYEITSSWSVTKYYYLNGQRVAMRQNGVLTYLHSDHLGGTIFTTDSSGSAGTDQGYYAYGRYRRGGTLPTDHKFTGQKLDATGLYYYNARYYDPELGQFISPDTLVPDPSNLFDYNRYMYVRGNPMGYNDPSGHCVNSTTKNAGDSIDYDNADCWRYADTIANMWDDTDYWSTRFNTKEVFLNYVANDATNGTDFFRTQLNLFLNDDAGKQWLERIPTVQRPEQDVGDYTSINGSLGFLGGAVIFDDYGNVYIRSDNNFVGSPGLVFSRGDILLSNGDSTWTDIDQAALSSEDKAALAPDILVGSSRGGSLGIGFTNAALAYNLQGPPHMTVEAGLTPSVGSASYSHFSYTFQIYPIMRFR